VKESQAGEERVREGRLVMGEICLKDGKVFKNEKM
jgi:hypothetical protein